MLPKLKLTFFGSLVIPKLEHRRVISEIEIKSGTWCKSWNLLSPELVAKVETYFLWKFDDPRWWHYDTLVRSQRTLFFNLLHHETWYLVVVRYLAPWTTDGNDFLKRYWNTCKWILLKYIEMNIIEIHWLYINFKWTHNLSKV